MLRSPLSCLFASMFLSVTAWGCAQVPPRADEALESDLARAAPAIVDVDAPVLVLTHSELHWGAIALAIRPSVDEQIALANRRGGDTVMLVHPWFADGDATTPIRTSATTGPILEDRRCGKRSSETVLDLDLCEHSLNARDGSPRYFPKGLDERTGFVFSQAGDFTKVQGRTEMKETLPLQRSDRTIVKGPSGKTLPSVPLANRYILGGGYITNCLCATIDGLVRYRTWLATSGVKVPEGLHRDEIDFELPVSAVYTADFTLADATAANDSANDTTLERLARSHGTAAFLDALRLHFVGVAVGEETASDLTCFATLGKKLTQPASLELSYAGLTRCFTAEPGQRFEESTCPSKTAKGTTTIRLRLT